jgi:hypothetical protein
MSEQGQSKVGIAQNHISRNKGHVQYIPVDEEHIAISIVRSSSTYAAYILYCTVEVLVCTYIHRIK